MEKVDFKGDYCIILYCNNICLALCVGVAPFLHYLLCFFYRGPLMQTHGYGTAVSISYLIC